jgi:hypothetical protein
MMMDGLDPMRLSLVESPTEAPMKKKRVRARRKPSSSPPAASELARWLEDFHAWEESATEERSDKLIEAKLRVSQGYYDRPEVQEQILRAILRDLFPSREARPTPGKAKRTRPTSSNRRLPPK